MHCWFGDGVAARLVMSLPESPFRPASSVVDRVRTLVDDGARLMDRYTAPVEGSRWPRIPTASELETLVTTAFWASPLREECHHALFSLDFSGSPFNHLAIPGFLPGFRFRTRNWSKVKAIAVAVSNARNPPNIRVALPQMCRRPRREATASNGRPRLVES